MFHLIFMNIAHLISKTKQKLKFLADLCDANTLFLYFCETFLHDGISDSEIQIPEFSITRCDRLSRVGGGVCIYLRNSVNFFTCVNYSNSLCDLLIININHPSLIVILMYRPPSCTTNEFNYIIAKVNQFIFSLSSPLPNIILCDFNLPGVDWLSPNMPSMTTPLVDLCDYLFLNQQVHKPTRKSNILDLIFCPNDLINTISISDTFISDHRMITVDTFIPIQCCVPNQIFNPPISKFGNLDFHRADWQSLLLSLQSIDWVVTLKSTSCSSCFEFFIDTLYHNCMNHVPLKKHGFRSGRSCLSALLGVFDDLMHMLSSDCTVDMIYLDFSKTFDKVDHGILLHKLKDLGITGKLGIWFFQFLTNRTHYVRLPGGLSQNSPVLSGVPQGTVLGPLLFLIMISDINKEITSSKVISFADDTRVYSNITQADDCDNLQSDLNTIYNWALYNNSQKFHYVSYSSSLSSNGTNVYVNPDLEIINPTNNVLDLGIFMSGDCSFEFHLKIVCKKCTNLSG